MEPTNKNQLTHHVFFWLKKPDSKEDLSQLIAGLRTLEKIESVRKLYIGTPARTEPREVIDATFSASELLLFDDIEGHDLYQKHPIHKAFIEKCGHLWQKVVIYDSAHV